MKLELDKNDVDLGVQTRPPREFKLEVSPKAFKVLFDLYSDKALSVCRELMSNAYDAHVSVGKNEPFEVSVEDELVVRDYGPGMSKRKIEEVYTTFFASTKQDDNSQVGAFGLGAKSPFCYAEAFYISSFQAGKALTYSIFLNERRVPEYVMVEEIKTEEPDGFKVVVPLQPDDAKTFTAAVKKLSTAYTLLGTQNRPRETMKSSLVSTPITSGLSLVNNTDLNVRSLYLLYGPVLYDVDVNKLKFSFKSPDVRNDAWAALRNYDAAKLIKLPLGTVDMTPSRESISYDDRTVANLSTHVENIIEELTERWHRLLTTSRGSFSRARQILNRLSKLRHHSFTSFFEQQFNKRNDSLFSPGVTSLVGIKRFTVGSNRLLTKTKDEELSWWSARADYSLYNSMLAVLGHAESYRYLQISYAGSDPRTKIKRYVNTALEAYLIDKARAGEELTVIAFIADPQIVKLMHAERIKELDPVELAPYVEKAKRLPPALAVDVMNPKSRDDAFVTTSAYALRRFTPANKKKELARLEQVLAKNKRVLVFLLPNSPSSAPNNIKDSYKFSQFINHLYRFRILDPKRDVCITALESQKALLPWDTARLVNGFAYIEYKLSRLKALRLRQAERELVASASCDLITLLRRPEWQDLSFGQELYGAIHAYDDQKSKLVERLEELTGVIVYLHRAEIRHNRQTLYISSDLTSKQRLDFSKQVSQQLHQVSPVLGTLFDASFEFDKEKTEELSLALRALIGDKT